MYDSDYRKLNISVRKKIYRAYANIINSLNMNSELRNKITGILYENNNNKFVLNLYRPFDGQDNRLTYQPLEITQIGKNSKTTIPFKLLDIDTVKASTEFDLIDFNMYGIYLIDSNVIGNIVFDPNEV